MTSTREEFERALEKSTGKTMKELRETPLCVLRAEAEAKFGPMRLSSASSHFITHEDAEKALQAALKE